APGIDAEHAPRRKLADARVRGARTGYVEELEVLEERLAIPGAIDPGQPQERLDLRGERQAPGIQAVVQRLDPEPIAHQQETPSVAIPDGDREHPVQSLREGVAEFLVRSEHHLRIAARGERSTAPLELLAQLPEVEDLAVVDDGPATICGQHRLVTALEIENREAAMTQRDRPIDVEARVIGAAVGEGLREGCDITATGGRPAVDVEHSGDPAHLPRSPSRIPWARAPKGSGAHEARSAATAPARRLAASRAGWVHRAPDQAARSASWSGADRSRPRASSASSTSPIGPKEC